ncbi:MAG: ABC transporter ATP-binding protein [candidate division Zixibacteria bacterium]|nr:ABC transporter ATP-binding protein [candidate division Zixibacteria bacterium]
MSLIKITDLHKSFNSQIVLQGINLEIKEGESLAIIGQSGCGKSVFLKSITRLLKPDRGDVYFGAKNLNELSSSELIKIRREIGMVFQSAALFDSLSVKDNVGLGLRESRLFKADEIERIVEEKLNLVGLADAADKSPSELSGGMRKRVGLARAIASNPKVLLYDEPTTGLDPVTADLINELIVDLNKKLNVTSLTVTHDMTSAYKIASRIIMLYNGCIEFDGSPDEIKKCKNEVVQQFINGKSRGPIKVR